MLRIQHLIMRPEGVFIILFSSPLSRVGREPRWGNVDHPSVSDKSGCRTLQQEKHAYAGNDHHDENVGCNQRV
jgi:hypothetical protein